MQQNPAPCPSPQTSTETNGAGIFPNRIIRSMSLHTFTYLRAYSRPPLEAASNRDGSDNISMATPPLKNGGSRRERSDDLFLKKIHANTTLLTLEDPLAPRAQGCV